MEWQLEAFESRTSLWRLIEEFVPESERIEIKEALGDDLVDETLDLQNEVSSFHWSRTMYMRGSSKTFTDAKNQDSKWFKPIVIANCDIYIVIAKHSL